MIYQLIIAAAVIAVTFVAAYKLGVNVGRGGKCPDKHFHGLTFDGCDYVLREVWGNATVEVSRCSKCGAVDISWRRQDNTVKVYENDISSAVDAWNRRANDEDRT